MSHKFVVLLCLALLPLAVEAQPKKQAKKAPSPLGPNSLEQFSTALKSFLVQSLPTKLYEKEHNWGHQEIAPKLQGLRIIHIPRNDGVWRKVHVTTHDLASNLELHVHHLRTVSKDKTAFKLFLALPTRVEVEEQIWESGHRLYSGSLRARLRIKLDLDLENTVKMEYKGGLLPDIVFRLKVVKANVSYDNLVVEHIAGIGGSAARLTGETIRSALKQWKPSIERDALAKASAAILKAGDTRQIRLSLSNLK